MNHLIPIAYPHGAESSDNGANDNGPHAAVVPHVKHLWSLLGALPALAFSYWVLARRSLLAAVLLAAGLLAEAALAWHVALLMTAAALVLGRRAGGLPRPRLAIFFILSFAIAGAEALFLVRHSAGSLKQIAGAMLGWPSVWPFIPIADYSAVG